MSLPRLVLSLVLAATAVVAPGCGASLATYQDSVGLWRSGQRADATSMARATYERFRDDNDLDEADVQRALAEARERLATEIVVPRGERPRVKVEDLLDPELGEIPLDSAADHGAELKAGVRADLLSGRATPTLRALESVRALRLEGEIPGVLAVIYRRDPIEADGGVLDQASTALRSVAAKRAALDVLERW